MAKTKLIPDSDSTSDSSTNELNVRLDALKARVVSDLKQNKIQPHADASGFTQPDKGNLDNILNQRYRQRNWLFGYSLVFSSLAFIGLVVMLIAQAVYKGQTRGGELFGALELETVALGVFIQFLGLIKIITDSLWNDKPYLDSGSLKK